MEEKKVSVIIPFYNGVEWLGEAVQSILDQTYKNVEIIVVNDGSPEDIKPFLDKYGNKVIYRYQENQGSAAARNHGLSLATGEYIAYEDADDIWLPTKLEKQIAFMEEKGHVWSHTGFYYWWPETGTTKVIDNRYAYDDIRRQQYFSVKMVMPSVVVHRKTKTEHPDIIFPVEYRKAQDIKYYEQLMRYYKLALIQEPLVKIRMRGDNSNGQVLVRFSLGAKAYKEYKAHPQKDMPKMAVFNMWLYNVYYKIFGDKRGNTREFLAKCLYTIPFGISRLSAWYIGKFSKKDENYILRYPNK